MNDGRFAIEISVDVGGVGQHVLVQLPGDATAGDLYRLLGSPESGLGLGRTPPLLFIERTGRPLQHDQLLVDTTLTAGDVLHPIVTGSEEPVGEFDILTGPAQGRTIAVPIVAGNDNDNDNGDERPGQTRLASGASCVVGRTTAAELDDPSLSRRHARMTLTPSGLTIEDLASTNGSVVNGKRVEPDHPVDVQIGDVVELGAIGLRLRSLPLGRRRLEQSPFVYQGGLLGFQPSPRAVPPRPAGGHELPLPPADPPRRRFPLVSALLPLVTGAVMAVLFGPIFAVFIAMSPVMVVWTFLDDRRSGRKSFESDRRAFEAELEQQRLVLADSRDQIEAWQRRQTPTPAQIRRWVRTGAKELWSRRPQHDDFLAVAVGAAGQPSPLPIDIPDQGSPDLVQKLREVAAPYQADHNAPVVVDLGSHAIVGITGGGSAADVPPGVAAGIARSLVTQLVGLRSPKHLALAVLAPEQHAWWGWTTWLGHNRTDLDPGRRMVAGNDDEAKQIFDELLQLAETRAEQAREHIGPGAREQAHVVVVIQPPLALAHAAVARLLALAPSVGMSVLYIAPDRHQLPGDVSLHIEASLNREGVEGPEMSGGRVNVHDLAAGTSINGVAPCLVSAEEAESLGRDLAPIVDLTRDNVESTMPITVSLDDVHRLWSDDPASPSDPEAMARRWMSDPRDLVATVGRDGDGPVTIDIAADGPHALVAGTTGAGKSEFLQTMVGSLATRHSPSDLNFILIDYKGGSAFRRCRALPHTVGFVTDLDDHLAQRALVSLRAELRRREKVFADAEVSDLAEMRQRDRHRLDGHLVPASLVIVVDEFAALRAEVPEFVDGLVDVAQRGRSMGVHMILATQKPAGVITPQIEANTNIRVALRMANASDSRDVIGSTVAAEIDTGHPGRGFIKIGGGSDLRTFQSAYVGGCSHDGEVVVPAVAVVGYGTSPGRLRPAAEVTSDSRSGGLGTAGDDAGETSDLDRIVDAAVRVWSTADGVSGTAGLPRRPWLPPLPPVVPLADVGPDADSVGERRRSPLEFTVGLADHPDRQAQEPYRLDLADAGHVALYGTSGSGKTTFLRTLAVSIASEAGGDVGGGAPDEENGHRGVVIYAVDFGGGLSMLRPLPAVADVIAGSDVERLELLLDHLESEVDRRRDLLSNAAAGRGHRSTVSAPTSSPPIVILVDGFGPFWAALSQRDHGRRADAFALLLSQARSVGIHFVISADQRRAIPYQCLGSIGLRLLQRLTSVDEYRALDLAHPPPSSMPPGRVLAVGGPEIQMALPGPVLAPSIGEAAPVGVDDPTQAAVIAAVGNDLVDRGVTRCGPAIKAMPDVVMIGDLDSTGEGLVVPIGLGRSHTAIEIDLIENPTLLVVGAGGSGRSTTLATLGRQLAPVVADRRAIVGKRISPLAAVGARAGQDGRQTEPYATVYTSGLDQVLVALAVEVEGRAGEGYQEPMLVAIDDADLFFDDNTVSSALTTLVLKGRDAGVILAMSATTFRTTTAYETWMRAMRSAGHGVVLQPDGDKEEDVFDVRFPRGGTGRFPVGRGYLVVRSTVQVVQIAVPDDRFSP